MYGIYITGRGWLKFIRVIHCKLVCCRNSSDIHSEFVFKNKHEFNRIVKKYSKELTGYTY